MPDDQAAPIEPRTGQSREAERFAAALAAFGRQSLFSGVSLERQLADGRRIAAIDMLRGLAALLMLLDYSQFFFGNAPLVPIPIGEASAGTFIIRWFVGWCAPIYVLLAGTGAFLRLASGQSKRQVSRFLIARGLLLIALDLTIVPLLKWFAYDPHWIETGPLWAIGWSMIALGGLIFLKIGAIGGIGIAIVFLHNLFDGLSADQLGFLRPVWISLHEPGVVQIAGGTSIELNWPLLPWIGVMACGFALGELYRLPEDLRRTMLLAMGANLVVWFLILRVLNFYGDPVPWKSQDDAGHSIMSFFNCTRTPPSLCDLMSSLGLLLLMLALFERQSKTRFRRLAVLGSVPLYFYFSQWLTLRAIAVGITLFRGQPTGWLFHTPDRAIQENDAAWGRGFGWQPQLGVDLPTVVLIWLIASVVLYAGCVRYAKLKFVRRPRWASYF